MRATLLAGVLLVVLALGVIEANRSREGGGLVSSWMPSGAPFGQGTDRPPEAAAEPVPDAAGPAAPSSKSSEPAVLAAGELSVVEGDEREPMVRYFDRSGSLHMVRGLERVPPEYRAGAVVVGRGNINLVSVPVPTAAAFQDWQPAPNVNRSSVVLFSATWCGPCKSARRYLDQRGVAFQERDIDDDPDAKAEVQRILGRVAIPLLDVDGRYISGFRPDVYARALGSS